MKTINTLLAIACLALGATQLSCSVNDYCLNCATGDAGHGSGSGDANDGGDIDAPVDAGCVPSGSETCDGVDNDCNGLIDDGVLPEVGDLCANQMGVCAGGTKECVAGQLKCSKTGSPEVCDGLDNNCNGTADEGDPGGGGKCGTEMGECVAGTLRCAATSGCNGSANCDPLTQNCCVKCFGNDNLPWVGGQYDHRTATELCNAKDDNCNGLFDENLTNLGACTWQGATNTGECNIGTLSCTGGTTTCTGAVFPKFEVCNGKDDDCNGQTDEIFNLQTDPQNCGTCGMVCPAKPKTCVGGSKNTMTCNTVADCPKNDPNDVNEVTSCDVNSQPKCAPNNQNVGTCGYQCNIGFIDLDLSATNGCEYKCTPTGNEECDGIDNNCNGQIDEGLTVPTGLCLQGGECGTTTPMCKGAAGWKCMYPGVTEFPEVSCDNKNNDCDANVDEGFPLKGTACNDGEAGVCLDTGTFICDPNDATKLKCNYTTNNPNLPFAQGQTPVEDCNGKDDNCNGTIDENLATGQDWVSIGNGKFMMKYEASKVDATATDQGSVKTITNGGVTTTQVCSKAGVQPWTNITYTQARAACQAIGADLCTESQWHRTCSAITSPTFPVATTTLPAYAEAEDYTGIAYATGGSPSATRAWVPDYTTGYSGIAAMEATPNSTTGTVASGSATTQAPRLDWTFSMSAASYHIWTRLYQTGAVTNSNNTIYVRLNTGSLVTVTLPAATACTTNTDCSALGSGTCVDAVPDINNVVDHCAGWQWADAGSFSATSGTNTVSVFMGTDGVKLDKIAVNQSTTAPADSIQSKGGTWSFATNATVWCSGTNCATVDNHATCNGQDYSPTDDNILKTGFLANCQPSNAAIFDLSGNVKEWTMAQKPGENPVRGGASNSTDVGISCALNFTLANDTFLFPNIGFRCCK